MKRMIRAAAGTLAMCVLATPASSRAADAKKGDDAAEVKDTSEIGTRQGMIRLSGGPQYTLTSPDGTKSLQGQIEYMISHVVGLKASGAIPIGDGPEGVQTLPGYLGANVHLLPKSRLDLHVGGSLGMAIMSHSEWGTTIMNPCAQAVFGGSLYLFGPLFGSMEGGYEIKRYSNAGHTVGLNGLFGNVQGGLFF